MASIVRQSTDTSADGSRNFAARPS
jgi:hypothetical protein